MSNRLLLGIALSVAITGCGGSGTQPAKQPPVASAGTDQTVKVGSTVLLDGTGSRDPQRLPLHFHWTLSPPSGSKAALDSAAAAQPSFFANLAGRYDVTLTVDDGELTSPIASVVVTATALTLKPVANAGSDRAVKVGAVVQLDGSASLDKDGDALTYRWALAAPSGSKATLSSAGSVMPSFTADVVGAYVVTLIVNDGSSDSAPATVTITAKDGNLPPVANAGSDRIVATSTIVELDGSQSSDPNGDMVTYKWTLTPPGGSAATLDSTIGNKAKFTADVAGQYTVTLVLNDGKVDSAPAKLTVTAEDKPVATITGWATAWLSAPVALDGTGSSSPGSGALTYKWSLSAPAGSTAALDSTVASKPKFTADVAGQYTVTLVVNDGAFDSDPAHLAIVAKPHTAPVAVVDVFVTACQGSSCQRVTTGEWRLGDIIELDGEHSHNTDSSNLRYAWTVLDPNGAAVTLTPITRTGTLVQFTPTATGDYSVTLVVNDGFNDSAPAAKTLTMGAANHAPIANAGPDQVVTMGDPVTLPGNLSSDPDGDPLTYSWSLTAPAASTATINAKVAAPTFVADQPGAYTASLAVFDGRATSVVTVKITARPHPFVYPQADRTIATGATITLGSVATESGGGGLTYAWTIKSGPSTDPSLLSATDRLLPKFTPTIDGAYVLELTATDENGLSASGDTTITAVTPIATPLAQPGNHYRPGQHISFIAKWQGIEQDTLIYAWSYDPAWNGGINVISNSSSQPTYFVEPLNRGDLTITLTITNNNGTNASTGAITVFIDPSNP